MELRETFLRFFILQSVFIHQEAAEIIKGALGLQDLSDGNYADAIDIVITNTEIILFNENITSKIAKAKSLALEYNDKLSFFSENALSVIVDLEKLSIKRSNLTDMPNIKPLAATLIELKLESCGIVFIPSGTFDGMTKLWTLEIKSCPLVGFPDVSGATSLNSLYLEYTTIPIIPEDYLSGSITVFRMANNIGPVNATSLLKIMSNMTILNLESNEITAHLDVVLDNCLTLTNVQLRSNALKEIPYFGNCTSTITWLQLEHNLISSIPSQIGSKMVSLKTLILNNNNLTAFPTAVNYLPALEELSLVGNTFSTVSSPITIKSPNLTLFDVNNIGLQNFPDISESPMLINLDLSKNHIKEINASFLSDQMLLKTRNLSYNELTVCPPIAVLNYLLTLKITDNQLQNLSWADANPTNLNISNLPLEELYVNSNNFEETTDFSLLLKTKSLWRLEMRGCNLKRLPSVITCLESLIDIYLDSNQLDEFPIDILSELPVLSSISLRYNNIKAIPRLAVKGMTNLTYINLLNNKLTTLGNILNSERSWLYVVLKNNNLICDWNICWMKMDAAALSTEIVLDETNTCTGPANLQNLKWEEITEDALGCNGKYVAGKSLPSITSCYFRTFLCPPITLSCFVMYFWSCLVMERGKSPSPLLHNDNYGWTLK